MKSWSLNLKIGVVISILSGGLILVAGVGLFQLGSVNKFMMEVTEVDVKNLSYTEHITALFYLQIINERNFILNEDPQARKSTMESLERRDKEIRETVQLRLAKAGPETAKHIEEFMTVYESWRSANKEVVRLFLAGDTKTGMAFILSKGRELRVAGETVLQKMVVIDLEKTDSQRVATAKAYAQARELMIALSVGLLFVAVGAGVIVLRAVSRSMNSVIGNLTENATQVSQEAQQIASASENLSQASTEQAASLEETVASLEELTSMVKINNANAREAAKLAESTREIAVKGENEVQGLLVSIGEIAADSKKIAEITSVVDDIAFQTNLLALNASVEAARAGEQGRGFAVVADAVRTLAQRSAMAAKDIADLIRTSVEKVDNGSRQAAQSGEVLDEVVAAIKKVADLNNEIASASDEQAQAITQINQAMNDLDKVTQVNAATSEETAASAQQLTGQAGRLNGTVGLLVLSIKGAHKADGVDAEKPAA